MKILRALVAFCLIPIMAGCSSSGQVMDGWNACVIGGGVAGAAAGVALDGNVPGAVVGAGLGMFVGAILCGDSDADGDGVADSADQCPNTPTGVAVDAKGCAIDSDGDGVADYKDKCPNTSKGVSVGANGCPLDSDGDGVLDYADKCPNTPARTAIDANGCAVKLAVLYIHFAFDSAQIMLNKGDTASSLVTAIKVLTDRPNDSVRLVGHTDNSGSAAYNQGLSDRRAAGVRNYLIRNGGIDGSRMSVEGRGESQPSVSNATREGRSQNRRVELELLK